MKDEAGAEANNILEVNMVRVMRIVLVALFVVSCTGAPPPTRVPSPQPVVVSPIVPTMTTAAMSLAKREFIAYGKVECGGMNPLPGCVYTVQEWIGPAGPVAVGKEIKVLLMNPRSVQQPETESCVNTPKDDLASGNSPTPLSVRVRGEPCDWQPERLFCVCGSDDFIRLETSSSP
ncbi:hypothetical protein ANRL4_02057 [Anaerolineae bacterium]|nr:hypothetical protein ANRL4_02057 [Anaerolineae bacterium]